MAFYLASTDLRVDDSREDCGGVHGTFYTDYQDNSAIGDTLDVSELVDGNTYAESGGAAFWLDDLADVQGLVGVTSGNVRVERSEVDSVFEDTYWLLEWDVT